MIVKSDKIGVGAGQEPVNILVSSDVAEGNEKQTAQEQTLQMRVYKVDRWLRKDHVGRS